MLLRANVPARRVLRRSMRRGAASVRVLFVGNTGMRKRLEQTFNETPGLGLVSVGRLNDEDEEGRETGTGAPLLGSLDGCQLLTVEDLAALWVRQIDPEANAR